LTLVALTFEIEATLNNLERNTGLEFRVIAVNKSGESIPRNTVDAVV